MLCDQPDGLLYKINLTRQQLQDETSINVKTLNRTISQLKKRDLFPWKRARSAIIKKIIKRL